MWQELFLIRSKSDEKDLRSMPPWYAILTHCEPLCTVAAPVVEMRDNAVRCQYPEILHRKGSFFT